MVFNSVFLSFLLSVAPTFSYASVQTTNKTKNSVIHTCKRADNPVNILACNMYREARGESDHGMIAVGFVTLNRKDNEEFPQTIRKIVYQSGQFSWTKHSSSFNVYDVEDWNRAKKFANTLVLLHTTNKSFYKVVDVTRGAVYYHSKKVKPYWAKGLTKTVKIENHVFYKEKPTS